MAKQRNHEITVDDQKLDVKYEKVLFNLNNISKLKQSDYRRAIRNSAVSRLVGALQEDMTFQSPIHVNKVGLNYWVIDGNHRIEALKNYLKRNQKATIEIPLAIHENLDKEREKELFDELAKTVNQTKSDVLKIHFEDIEIFQWIDNSFPIPLSIYSNKSALSYANLLECWYNRERDTVLHFRKESIVPYAKQLDKKDYTELKDFFRVYLSVFGAPSNSSPYYKRGPLWIVMSIYFRNIDVINTEQFWALVRKKCFNNLILLDAAKNPNRNAIEDNRRLLLERHLNKSWRGNRLV